MLRGSCEGAMSVYIGVVRVTRLQKGHTSYTSYTFQKNYTSYIDIVGALTGLKKRWVLIRLRKFPTLLCSRVSLCASTIRISEGAQDGGIRAPLGP